MQTKRLLLFFVLIMTLFSAVSAVSAQDADGDGISDRIDRCPREAGVLETNGCPVRAADPAPDRDGDGVADFVDQCPDAAGTGFTNGCPVSANPNLGVQPNPTQIPYLEWITEDYCLVGVPENADYSVNVRSFVPDGGGMMPVIIGVLNPGDMFAPAFAELDHNGETWYFGALNAGWVADSAVIDNGACFDLPGWTSQNACTMMIKTELFEGIEIKPLPLDSFSEPYLHANPGEFLFDAEVWLMDANNTLWVADGYFWVHASDVVDINGTCWDEDSFSALEPMPNDYYDSVYPDSLIQWLAGLGYDQADFPLNQAIQVQIDLNILNVIVTPTPGN